MKTLLTCLVLLILTSPLALGQGWIFNEGDYKRAPIDSSFLSLLRSGEVEIDTSFSLKKYTPPVQDQGTNHTCLAHALATAYSVRASFPNKPLKHFSASYIANQVEHACDSGIVIEEVALVLEKNGMCPNTIFKNRPICAPYPEENILEIGQQYPISLLTRIHDPRYDREQFLSSIKINVSSGVPVIAAIVFSERFRKCDGCTIWAPNEDEELHVTLHALVIIGYNDHQGVFEAVNSYGKDWGKGGYIRIAYGDLYQVTKGLYIIE